MVIVGTSAETAPTVPKDNATVSRRIDVVVRATAVSLRLVDRIAPAVPVVVPVSGAIATTVEETAPTIAVDTRGATTVVDTRVATTAVTTAVTSAVVNAGPMTAAPSRDAATIVAVAAARAAVVAKVDSDRHAIARPSVSSAAMRAPTNRTSRRTWRRRSWIRLSAAIC